MQCSLLKTIVSRAAEFSGKADFAQNCVFRVRNNTLELRASNGMTGICIISNLDVDIKDLSCAVNVYALEHALKSFDSDADLKITINKAKLTFKADNSNDHAELPMMDEDTVFYIPKPLNWLPTPPNFAEKLATIKGMHFKLLQGMDKDGDDLIIINGTDICQLSRSVYVFETTQTDVKISVELKLLQRISDNIDEYCVENNRLYLKNADEWCMVSASSKTIPKYNVIFTELQKTNTSVIRLNSDLFYNFCDKLLNLKKAEEYSNLGNNHSVCLEFKEGVMRGLTEVGSTQITIENKDQNFICLIVSDFIKATSHRLFLKEDDLELHIGKDMRLMMATCGTTKVMGTICRA